MKKIFFIIPSLAGGGAEKILIYLLENLDRNKFDVACIFYEDSHIYSVPGNIRVFNLRTRGDKNLALKAFKFFKRIFGIKAILDKEKPDIVFSFLNVVNILVITASKLSKANPYLIVSERNTPSHELSGCLGLIQKFLIKILYPSADKIVAISEGVKKDLVERFKIDPNKIQTIYNPIDIDKVSKSTTETIEDCDWFRDSKVPIVINVARLTAQKGHKDLIRAFRFVRDKMAARLVIIGEGKEKASLEKLILDLGLKGDVRLLGFKFNPYKYMAKSQVFVLSSLHEGFGNVILEAMVCGVPVISTDCPAGPSEIINSPTNGVLVPVSDPEKLAEAIISLLESPAMRETIILGQRQRVVDFKLSTIVPQYESLLN